METYPDLLKELPLDDPAKAFPRLTSAHHEFGHAQHRVVSTLGVRRWRFDHKALTNSEVGQLETFWAAIRGNAVFEFVNPDDANETVKARLVSPGKIVMASLKTIWDVRGVEVEEVLPW